MKLEGTSLIGWGRAKPTGIATPAVNPATGDSLDPAYFWASGEDVDRAATLASQAFSIYGRLPAARRAGFLRAIAGGLEANAAEIVARANQETALPAARLQGEITRTCGQLRLFASLVDQGWWVDARIDHPDQARAPIPKPDVRSMLRPLGPVAVFSSSNFPLAFSVTGGDTASALAAGCPVLIKVHQGHMGTSELVGMIVRDAAQACEMPEGVFSLLFGPGREVGMALVRHPLVKAVGFTGSRAGGRALMDAAAARPEPIPVYAEMGSINPVFLLPGAFRDRTSELAQGLHVSVTLGFGQFCTNPGLVFCPAGESCDRFLESLERLMSATPAGTMLTESICGEYRAGLAKFAQASGVRRTVAVEAPDGRGLAQAGAALFVTDAPTFLRNPTLKEEVFGPSTLIVRTASRKEMLECAHVQEGQLTATLHATDEDLAAHHELVAVLETKVGRLVCNGFPTGVEVCHAMHHGGPYPATSEGRSTSVGTRAIQRFARPVCFQNFPDAALPDELREANPLTLARLVDGQWGRH